MKKLFGLILALIFLPCLAQAATKWVSPTGAATWANCGGETPLEGTAACSRATAMTNAAAGDIVYFRGGAYSVDVAGLTGAIQPTNTGSAGNPITFEAYTAETPVITNADTADTTVYAILLNGKSYINITGITFVDWNRWPYLKNGANHNIISYCTIYNSTITSNQGLFISGFVSGTNYSNGSTHNWIHHNTMYNLFQNPCSEGGDIIRVGSASAGDTTSNNNTVEDNTLYHAGHTVTEDYGINNVWRNNIIRNDGFKTDITHVTGTATGGSTTTLIDTTVNFVTAGAVVGRYVHDLSDPNAYGPRTAAITSISTTTNPNDTLHFSVGSGSPTFANTHSYDIGCRYWVDNDPPSSGKYGHRGMSFTGYDATAERQTLIEGNRVGYATVNPANNGADNLTLGSPGNIARFNDLFGAEGPGVNLKSYAASETKSGAYNRIYNNTIYNNAQYSGGGDPVSPVFRAGLQQYSTYSRYNRIKNNLFYLNNIDLAGGGYSYGSQTWANNWCNNNEVGCTIQSGDPLFTDTDMTDMTSLVLPDLTIPAGSPAVNAGTYLTQANGAGTDSDTLIVDDALYFQDGTWGSSLSDIQADWIAIGTVSNVHQISSINYATNTIKLATTTTWADNANIWLYKKSDGVQVLYGSAPDIGAHEYSGTPNYTLTLTVAGTGTGTVTSSPAGIDTITSTTADFLVDTEVTLTGTPSAGATLEWSGVGGCTGSSTGVLTMSEARAATATFTASPPVNYIVTRSYVGSGTTSPVAGTEEVASGATATTTQTPSDHWSLQEWAGTCGCTGTGACAPVISANCTIYPIWVEDPKYILSVTIPSNGENITSDIGGINCGGGWLECYASYYSELVTLTATCASGWTGAIFSGDCHVNPCELTVSAAKAVAVACTRTLGTGKTGPGGSMKLGPGGGRIKVGP